MPNCLQIWWLGHWIEGKGHVNFQKNYPIIIFVGRIFNELMIIISLICNRQLCMRIISLIDIRCDRLATNCRRCLSTKKTCQVIAHFTSVFNYAVLNQFCSVHSCNHFSVNDSVQFCQFSEGAAFGYRLFYMWIYMNE